MARTGIVPFADMNRRAPEAGRIRIGVKAGRAMKSIDTFRFTSQHRDLIERLAQMYGGKVEPWDDEKARIRNQWQVITTTNQIPVYVPQNGLSQDYELWTGGGCARRCDGITVEVVRMHGDDAVPEQAPCLCVAEGVRKCAPYTRVTVVLPGLPFLGTWRLETKGWNAAQEIPGMFDLVRSLHDSQVMVQALLGVEARTDRVAGKTRNFVVPTLAVAESPLEIQAGQAAVGAIGAGARAELAGPRGALTSGSATRCDGNHAEPPCADPQCWCKPPPDDIEQGEVVSAYDMACINLRRDAHQFGLDGDEFVAACEKTAKGDVAVLQKFHADMIGDVVEPVGFRANGSINWRQL